MSQFGAHRNANGAQAPSSFRSQTVSCGSAPEPLISIDVTGLFAVDAEKLLLGVEPERAGISEGDFVDFSFWQFPFVWPEWARYALPEWAGYTADTARRRAIGLPVSSSSRPGYRSNNV